MFQTTNQMESNSFSREIELYLVQLLYCPYLSINYIVDSYFVQIDI